MSKTITIDKDFLEHLLGCLANQKFMPMDNLSANEQEKQRIIDEAYAKGWELLAGPLKDPT